MVRCAFSQLIEKCNGFWQTVLGHTELNSPHHQNDRIWGELDSYLRTARSQWRRLLTIPFFLGAHRMTLIWVHLFNYQRSIGSACAFVDLIKINFSLRRVSYQFQGHRIRHEFYGYLADVGSDRSRLLQVTVFPRPKSTRLRGSYFFQYQDTVETSSPSINVVKINLGPGGVGYHVD